MEGTQGEEALSQLEELAQAWSDARRFSMQDLESFWSVVRKAEVKESDGPSRGAVGTSSMTFGVLPLAAPPASGHRWSHGRLPKTLRYLNECMKLQHPEGRWTTLQIVENHRSPQDGVPKGPLTETQRASEWKSRTCGRVLSSCTAYRLNLGSEIPFDVQEGLTAACFPWSPPAKLTELPKTLRPW